ncbi:MAG: MotA/TolQ/ExbB proton channel family protein [Betaproteobacteria bacterium]|jgi:biopolymer transport protein ExbB|nr:MotA/TolQ/ExbB proton channel family protein [Betaproteobacteria bacterium]MBT7427327.1 MotA/TolQ/ExbB proton channel family protein [Betaproteobacteria bacterium]
MDFETIMHFSKMSGGLLPTMALLLLITIAVIVERLYFYHRVVKSGATLEHDLNVVEHQNSVQLKELESHYETTLQVSLIKAATAAKQQDVSAMDRQIEESIMWQLPKLDRGIWVLDTSVTLAPLMGLLGTIIGMVHAFDILGAAENTGNSTKMVTGGIAEALVATGAGLLIAIVAVLFLNHFNKRMRVAMHQMDLIKTMLINRFHGNS